MTVRGWGARLLQGEVRVSSNGYRPGLSGVVVVTGPAVCQRLLLGGGFIKRLPTGGSSGVAARAGRV
ncbi:hypothetical protein GCM10010449_46200 [Streptomyces rectiviolaceus]|uniref:Uncharacterized protein n=1 Tax=Streptomyces rectiviolaceus TaxID=332591 RepID=A0ABP6MP50_9ACTN